MNFPTEVFGDVAVVHSLEEHGEEQAAMLGDHLANLAQSKIILDMDNTETIESVGLEALLVAKRSLREQNRMIKIAVTNATNRKIIEITRLDLQLEVFESVIDAVNSFR